MRSLSLSLFFFILCSGCYHVSSDLDPKINYAIADTDLTALHSPFEPMIPSEIEKNWSEEYKIGVQFAKEIDFYRAITAFKRASFLLPMKASFRKDQIEYSTVLAYYLGQRYGEVLQLFEKSDLPKVEKSFPPFHDLLVILYDSYRKEGEKKKADLIYEVIDKNYPFTAKNLKTSTLLLEGDLWALHGIAKKDPEKQKELSNMLCCYQKEKKSIRGAQLLNAVLPGSGYLYLGQKKSALTSFLINAAFIAASVEFFKKGLIAPGIIATSFEMGWYFGGIYGAGEEAKFYNQTLYQDKAGALLQKKELFPVFMLQFGF